MMSPGKRSPAQHAGGSETHRRGTAPDADLVALAIGGDQKALERLLLQVHDQLAARIAPLIPRDLAALVTADDVLQEAYVVAFREIAGFEPRGSGALLAWLTRIAEHRLSEALHRHRALKRGGGRARVSDFASGEAQCVIDALGALAVSPRTPSRSIARREAVDAVRIALTEISSDYAAALRLRYIEGLSVAQAAERMQRTPRAVEMLCHRGLAELRTAMGGDAARFFSSA